MNTFSAKKRLSGIATGLLTVMLIATPALADFQARVVGIVDSNTIRVLKGKRVTKIRLFGIDCPDKKQPYGKQAKKALRSMVFGSSVTIQEKDKDPVGRLVAVVLAKDGREVNRELVKAGWCWAYERHTDQYAQDQEAARKAKLGLWQGPNPVQPEIWRYRKENTKKGMTPLLPEQPDDDAYVPLDAR